MTEQDSHKQIIDSGNSSRILALLQALQQIPAGRVVYKQIQRMLEEKDKTDSLVTRGYASIALILLDSYRRQLPKDSLLYLELKLIEQRLLPPISVSELNNLKQYLKKAATLINELVVADTDLLYDALSPLIGPVSDDTPTPVQKEEKEFEPHASLQIEQQINSVYRHKLDQQRHEMELLQLDLSEKLELASQQHEKIGQFLESTLETLNRMEQEQDVHLIRQKLTRLVEKSLSMRVSFSDTLHETHALLQMVNINNQKINNELDQVRVLSLTDDLTRLPNRRAFVRRLEDEIGRSQREQSPLTLGLLDLDHFKAINDQYGHNIGDEILQCYAMDILSIFRQYDMVARYGGEEFAVLLPNTEQEGAMRALNKVRNKVLAYEFKNEKEHFSLPTFSAGLAIHKPGEPVKNLIERADDMLYKAKQRGRNRIEFDTTYLGETHKETTETKLEN